MLFLIPTTLSSVGQPPTTPNLVLMYSLGSFLNSFFMQSVSHSGWLLHQPPTFHPPILILSPAITLLFLHLNGRSHQSCVNWRLSYHLFSLSWLKMVLRSSIGIRFPSIFLFHLDFFFSLFPFLFPHVCPLASLMRLPSLFQPLWLQEPIWRFL